MPESHSWVLLTMGDRPEQVARAVASIRRQSIEPTEVLVVGNGVELDTMEGTSVVTLPANVGIAAGRNAGARAARGDVVFFLDDDAECLGDEVTAAVLDVLAARPEVAAVSLRVVDAASGETQRRHVPRLRVGDPMRPSDVTTFLGGACAIRRGAFVEAGGYPDAFFYAMEETDLAWRLLDLGHSIHYLADAAVHHPATTPARHGHAFVATARNRVWLARRRLPLSLQPLYLLTWTVLMLLRAPGWRARRQVVAGLAEGVRIPAPRPFARISWRTVGRMVRLGRPPII